MVKTRKIPNLLLPEEALIEESNAAMRNLAGPATDRITRKYKKDVFGNQIARVHILELYLKGVSRQQIVNRYYPALKQKHVKEIIESFRGSMEMDKGSKHAWKHNKNRKFDEHGRVKTMVKNSPQIQAPNYLDSIAKEMRERGVDWRDGADNLKGKLVEYFPKQHWALTIANREYILKKMRE
jgi:hypothetical protein